MDLLHVADLRPNHFKYIKGKNQELNQNFKNSDASNKNKILHTNVLIPDKSFHHNTTFLVTQSTFYHFLLHYSLSFIGLSSLQPALLLALPVLLPPLYILTSNRF